MLGLYYNGFVGMNSSGGFTIPISVMAICSLVMGLGTSVGGMRIIKSVGMDMVKLEKYQGFSADLSAKNRTTCCLSFWNTCFNNTYQNNCNHGGWSR